MSKSHLSLVAGNGKTATNKLASLAEFQEMVEEVEVEHLGFPEFEFFEATTRGELKAQIEEWRQTEVIDNPLIGGMEVMSPTVSADGVWRATVNYLIFESGVDPWS